MEAPKKLYLIQDNGLICYCRNNKDDIEYTHINAFIKKACAFLETYPHMFFGVLRSDMIEDFKNYMKGE